MGERCEWNIVYSGQRVYMEGGNDIAYTVHWVPRLYKDRNRNQANSNAKRNENVESIK